MYSNVISLSERLAVKERKEDYSARVQLDEIMKEHFYIQNKRPIIKVGSIDEFRNRAGLN